MVKGKIIEKGGVKYVVNTIKIKEEVLRKDLKEFIEFNSIDEIVETIDISSRKLYKFLRGDKLSTVYEQRLSAYLYQNSY